MDAVTYFNAASAADEGSLFQRGIDRLASAQRAITSCLSKPDKRIWLAVGRLDVSVLRAVDCNGLLQPGQQVLTGSVQRIVLHRSQLATDVLDLLTRLLMVRDHQGRHSWLDTPRAPAQLQVVADLLNILTYMWRTVAESNRMLSLNRPPVDRHDDDRIVSMVSGGNTCSVLSQGMACMQHSSSSGSSTHRDQALVDVANAAAVASASLLYLMAACPAAFSVVVDISTPPLHIQACKIIALRRTGRRVGYFDMAACLLACSVSSCCDDVLDQKSRSFDQLVVPCGGVAALLGRDPAVCGALLDTLHRSLSVLLPSSSGRIADGLLEPEPAECVARGSMDLWLLHALKSVFAASGWALAPVTTAHITALVRHKRHARADYVLGCTCAAAVKLLPHVQPPDAFPFAFQQALGLVKSVAQRSVGCGDVGCNADDVVSQLNELMAPVPAGGAKRLLYLLFRAKCILDEGLLADCEHLLRQTWRKYVAQPRRAERDVTRAPVNTAACEGLCRLAAHLITAIALGADAALHRAAADAVLSAVATVRKVLCHVARTAGAQQHQLWVMASTFTVGCAGAEVRRGRDAAEPQGGDCEGAAASQTGVDSLLAVAGNGSGATVDSAHAQAAPGERTEAGVDSTHAGVGTTQAGVDDTKAAAGAATEAVVGVAEAVVDNPQAASGQGAGAGMVGAEVGVDGIQAAAGESRGTTSAAAAKAAAAAAEVAVGEGRGTAAATAAATAEGYAEEHAGGAAAAHGRKGISMADTNMQVEDAYASAPADAPEFWKQYHEELLDFALQLQGSLSRALSMFSVLLQLRGEHQWFDHVVHCAALQLLLPTVHLVRHVPASDASAAAAVLNTLTSHLHCLHAQQPHLEFPLWWSMLADPFAIALNRVLCHVETDQPSQPWQQQLQQPPPRQQPLQQQQQQQQPSPREQQLQGRFKALTSLVTGLALLVTSAVQRNDPMLQRFLQQLLQPALVSRIEAATSTAEYTAWLGCHELPAAMTSAFAACTDKAGAAPSLVEDRTRGMRLDAHILEALQTISRMHGSQQSPTGAAERVSWDTMALATADVFKDDTRPFLLGCWYRGCTNLDGKREADLQLSTCGGCHLARYCSGTCQRRAWRAGHRAACVSWQEGKARSRLPSDVASPSPEHRQSETAQ